MCDLSVGYMTTLIGFLKLTCCEKGVHKIEFMQNNSDCGEKEKIELENISDENKGILSDLIYWLSCYFDEHPILCSAPTICPVLFHSKGKFTKHVYDTLFSNVKFGSTISYGNLAKLCGSGGASRAVGTAMKNNPIPILIPCHRVIKSDGSIGHYSAGVNIKKWLLFHENK